MFSSQLIRFTCIQLSTIFSKTGKQFIGLKESISFRGLPGLDKGIILVILKIEGKIDVVIILLIT